MPCFPGALTLPLPHARPARQPPGQRDVIDTVQQDPVPGRRVLVRAAEQTPDVDTNLE